jgi:Zn finger protein HypA/HybF involved in hydrogenase expression
MAALSWHKIIDRAAENNKIVLHEIFDKDKRYFKVRCVICSDEFAIRIDAFKSCYTCKSLIQSSNNEDFILKSKIIHSDKYDYGLVEYVKARIKVKIKCNKCKTIFLQRPTDHLNRNGCPRCNESKGEVRVTKYLKKKGIAFKPQQEFKDLKHKKCLKFDFYLTEHNILAEYDGVGHYKATFGSTPEEKQKNFEDCQRRDKIKNEWAKANNIPLLRIPYWDFDRIEELIESFILRNNREIEKKLEL